MSTAYGCGAAHAQASRGLSPQGIGGRQRGASPAGTSRQCGATTGGSAARCDAQPDHGSYDSYRAPRYHTAILGDPGIFACVAVRCAAQKPSGGLRLPDNTARYGGQAAPRGG